MTNQADPVNRTRLLSKATALGLALVATTGSAFAQGFIKKDQDLPNASHFYMARPQIQIIDESPLINHQTNPGGGAAGSGALPGGGYALPKAGWTPYSQQVPGLSTNLPKVNNGVPPKAPPTPPNGMHGRTGKFVAPKAKSSTPRPAVSSSQSVKSYAPYKQYEPESPASGSAAMQSNSKVQGSLLHWARPHR